MTFHVNNEGVTTDKNVNSIFKSFGVPNSIIEIGTYEGRTTWFITDSYSNLLPKMDIYCIDPHDTSYDLTTDLKVVKENFLHNLSVCKNKNIHYINKTSDDGLLELISKNVKAQFIFVDGDHRGSTVLSDLVLAFKLLEVGGIILCDDVNWRHPETSSIMDSPNMSPRMAVENFIQVNWHRVRVINLPHPGQTAFIKTAE
jgi:predicted O-methyltransferase YrrM